MAHSQNTPRRKRYNKHDRMRLAPKWLQEHLPLKHVIKSYAKWYGVSRLTAALELVTLGMTFDTDVVGREKQLEIDKANMRKEAKEKRLLEMKVSNFMDGYDANNDEDDMPF